MTDFELTQQKAAEVLAALGVDITDEQFIEAAKRVENNPEIFNDLLATVQTVAPPNATPAQIEATADIVTVEYKGQTFDFPGSLDKASGDVLDAIDDMKISHALRGLLSDADWKRFKNTKPLVEDYGGLFDVYAAAIGLGSSGE